MAMPGGAAIGRVRQRGPHPIGQMAWAHLGDAAFVEAILEPRRVYHRHPPLTRLFALVTCDARADEVRARAVESILVLAAEQLDQLDA
jgi:hypothetical protein